MRVIILAAGKSQRFVAAGYTVPKPFLPIVWRGITRLMIIHVINSIPEQFTKLIVAVPPGHEKEIEFHTPSPQCIEVEGTKGPAHTLQRVLHRLPDIESTLVMDSDVLNYHLDLFGLTKESVCSVLVSPSTDPSYSYVNKLGYFDNIVEKEVISEHAVRGAYYIPRLHMSEFMAVLDNVVEEEDEPYISHVFNSMQGLKYALQTTYMPIDWGTPEAVRMSGARIISKEKRHASDHR